MILHFSHIGLTDGLTFIDPLRLVPAIRLWLPPRPPLPGRGGSQRRTNTPHLSRTADGSNSFRPSRAGSAHARRALGGPLGRARRRKIAPWGQDSGTRARDRDRELEVRRQRAVAREDRPSVLVHAHLRASGS